MLGRPVQAEGVLGRRSLGGLRSSRARLPTSTRSGSGVSVGRAALPENRAAPRGPSAGRCARTASAPAGSAPARPARSAAGPQASFPGPAVGAAGPLRKFAGQRRARRADGPGLRATGDESDAAPPAAGGAGFELRRPPSRGLKAPRPCKDPEPEARAQGVTRSWGEAGPATGRGLGGRGPRNGAGRGVDPAALCAHLSPAPGRPHLCALSLRLYSAWSLPTHDFSGRREGFLHSPSVFSKIDFAIKKVITPNHRLFGHRNFHSRFINEIRETPRSLLRPYKDTGHLCEVWSPEARRPWTWVRANRRGCPLAHLQQVWAPLPRPSLSARCGEMRGADPHSQPDLTFRFFPLPRHIFWCHPACV